MIRIDNRAIGLYKEEEVLLMDKDYRISYMEILLLLALTIKTL